MALDFGEVRGKKPIIQYFYPFLLVAYNAGRRRVNCDLDC